MRVLLVATAKWQYRNGLTIRELRNRGFVFTTVSVASEVGAQLKENHYDGLIVGNSKLDGEPSLAYALALADVGSRVKWGVWLASKGQSPEGIAACWHLSLNDCFQDIGLPVCPSEKQLESAFRLAEKERIRSELAPKSRAENNIAAPANLANEREDEDDDEDEDLDEEEGQDLSEAEHSTEDVDGWETGYIPGTSEPVDGGTCHCRGCGCQMGLDEAGFEFLCYDCRDAVENQERKHPTQRKMFSSACPRCGVLYAEGTTTCWECESRRKTVKQEAGPGCLLFVAAAAGVVAARFVFMIG